MFHFNYVLMFNLKAEAFPFDFHPYVKLKKKLQQPRTASKFPELFLIKKKTQSFFQSKINVQQKS